MTRPVRNADTCTFVGRTTLTWFAVVTFVTGLTLSAEAATGTATRSLETRESISRIVLEVANGGIQDGFRARVQSKDVARAIREGHGLPTLQIDGRPRTGPIAWLAACNRVAGYILDRNAAGSVEYSYRLRIRGLNVWRSTRIEDGHVLLTTDISGPMAGGRLYYAKLLIVSTESQAGTTTISATAKASSHIGERCRIVRRIAEREISKGLDRQLLAAIEAGGRRWHEAGHVDIEGAAEEFIRRMMR